METKKKFTLTFEKKGGSINVSEDSTGFTGIERIGLLQIELQNRINIMVIEGKPEKVDEKPKKTYIED